MNIQLSGHGALLVALLDSGASDSYIDSTLVDNLKLKQHQLQEPIEVTNFDGRASEHGLVTHVCYETISLEGHKFVNQGLLVLPLPGDASVVLGYDFHDSSNIRIDFRNRIINFDRAAEPPLEKGLETAAPCLPIQPPRVTLRVAKSHPDIVNPPDLDELRPDWLEEQHYLPPDLEKCLSLVTSRYHDYIDIFSKDSAESLPLHSDFDIKLNLVPGVVPPFGGIYRLATPEQNTLKEYIDDMLSKGLIRESSSMAALPVLFVPKKGGKLRLCVDYRRLNNMTVKDHYPLPSTDMLLDQLARAKIYTKLDLCWAYHRVRITAGDEWKTAFRTRYGLFEYLVMPFGLTTAPASFQRMVNTVLRPYIDQFVIVYLDDILVYSENEDDHHQHVRLVMDTLRAHALYAKPEKCDFDVKEVEYLGFRVTPTGVTSDPAVTTQILRPRTTRREE